MTMTWVICASRRLRGTLPDNEASCSVQDESPRPVSAQAQQDISVHDLSDNTYVNVATPSQEHSTAHGQMYMDSALCVDDHSCPEEHIYESAGDIAQPMHTDYANCQERGFPEENNYDSASDIEEQMYTNCTNYQQKCSLEEHICESATDIEESSDSRSERNSIYECERDTDAQQSVRNSIYADFT
ncbi:uncharacterized protein LOC125037063 [Penaeus chinensis]|uniref:uncharacterized protein LOC125037063 n=1 Tax=Penaeus chinensis TaxID=139456 RepID=UPI001FB814D1|nr:uncharacterized protein LOC125037063 [Penaeus chinensis]